MRKTKKVHNSKKDLFIYVAGGMAVLALLLFSQIVLNTKVITTNKASTMPIIGGTAVARGQFPSVVRAKTFLSDDKQTYKLCTGILIDPKWILTAAHCLKWEGVTMKEALVAIGIVNENEFDSAAVKSKLLIPHGDFTTDGDTNDIGLIQLENEYKGVASSRIPKIPQLSVAEDESKYNKGNMITAIGWGCSSIDNMWKICSQIRSSSDEAKTLECESKRNDGFNCGYHMDCHECMPWDRTDIDYSSSEENCNQIRNKIAQANAVPSPVFPVEDVAKVYGKTLQKITLPIHSDNNITNNEFEYGYGEEDPQSSLTKTSCTGDSGGPIFYQANNGLYVLGVIVSASSGTSVFAPKATNVLKYAQWIRNEMEINSGKVFLPIIPLKK